MPYSNILEFSKCKENCFFCGARLKARITSYTVSDYTISDGKAEISIPIIGSDDVWVRIEHAEDNWRLAFRCDIGLMNNSIKFTVEENEETETTDWVVAQNVFYHLLPHVQLYCDNAKCKFQYTLASDYIHTGPTDSSLIVPLCINYESFVVGNLWVQNNYSNQKTFIYTRNNWTASPLMYPFINWEKMGKENLLNRIKTLVVFS